MLEKEKIVEIDVQVYKCKEDKNEIDNLYKTIYPEMCDYAKICANKYKNLNLDQEDFLYCFYSATDRAIKSFAYEKGSFMNYWRRVLKSEAVRYVMSVYNSLTFKNESKIVRYDLLKPWKQDVVFNSSIQPESDISLVKDADIIINYVKSKYSMEDCEMFIRWLSGETFKEIATKYNRQCKQVSSKIYAMLATVKRRFINSI